MGTAVININVRIFPENGVQTRMSGGRTVFPYQQKCEKYKHMVVTKHVPIYRFGRYEQPITVLCDDGKLFDDVLFSLKPPDNQAIDTFALHLINRANIVPDQILMISVDEVELVLKNKGVMAVEDKWETWKTNSEIKPHG